MGLGQPPASCPVAAVVYRFWPRGFCFCSRVRLSHPFSGKGIPNRSGVALWNPTRHVCGQKERKRARETSLRGGFPLPGGPRSPPEAGSREARMDGAGGRGRARVGAGAPRSPSSCAVPPSLSILGALPLNYESSEGLSPLKDLQAYQAGAGRPAPGHHANARCSASRGFCLPLQVTNAYRALAMGRAPGWRLGGRSRKIRHEPCSPGGRR